MRRILLLFLFVVCAVLVIAHVRGAPPVKSAPPDAGTQDITARLQMQAKTIADGGIIQLPRAGILTDTITLSGRRSVAVLGGVNSAGSVLTWQGPADRPAFRILGCFEPRLEGFTLIARKDDHPLAEGIRFETSDRGTARRARLQRCVINGVNGGIGIAVRFMPGSGGNNLNSENLLLDCCFQNYGNCGLSIEHNQSKDTVVERCEFSGSGFGKCGYKGCASVYFRECNANENTFSDLWQTDADDRLAVDWWDSEGSARLLIVASDRPDVPGGFGLSGAKQEVSLRNIRFAGNGVAPDGAAILRYYPGIVSMDGVNSWKPHKVPLISRTVYPKGPDLVLK